jgi:hypothetical protein
MNLKEYFIKKAFLYDKAGNFKKADIITDMVKTAQQIQLYNHLFSPKSYDYEGNNPYISSSLDPSSMQGTLGFDLAGDVRAPGGFLSDSIEGTNAPFTFENLSPEQMKYYMDHPDEWMKFHNRMREKKQYLSRDLTLKANETESDMIRKVFTSSDVQDDPKLKKLLDAQLGVFESYIIRQIAQKVASPQAIKQSYVNLINRVPVYNNHPKLKQYLISRINNIQ